MRQYLRHEPPELKRKAFIVIKDGNGVSNVKQELAFDEKAVMKEVQNELEKH